MPSRLATESRARTRASSLQRSRPCELPRIATVQALPGAAHRESAGDAAPVAEYSVPAWHTRNPRPAFGRRPTGRIRPVTLLPWEYLFQSFSASHFHDLFYPVALGSLVLLIALCVLYAVQTRQLRHHAPYLDLYEWLLWTGII